MNLSKIFGLQVWTGVLFPICRSKKRELLQPQLEEAEIELIRLVTLTTPIERIKTIASKGKGFLYTVTIKGITGARNEYDSELNQFLKAVKEVSPIPVLAGFGISNQEQITDLTKYCDGVIVGSKIVDLFNSQNLLEMEKLMSIFKPKSKIV